MQHMISVSVLMAVIPLVMLGCQAKSASHHDEVLRTGMTMEQALTLLRKGGMNPQETVEAMERADGKPFDLYVLEPSGGSDVLYLMMVESPEGVKVLDDIYWWISGVTDRKRPKGLRDYNQKSVTHVEVAEIKNRLRGSEEKGPKP